MDVDEDLTELISEACTASATPTPSIAGNTPTLAFIAWLSPGSSRARKYMKHTATHVTESELPRNKQRWRESNKLHQGGNATFLDRPVQNHHDEKF